MALILQDTNILLRGAQIAQAQHQETLDAQAFLRNRGDKFCIVAQNLVEFGLSPGTFVRSFETA